MRNRVAVLATLLILALCLTYLYVASAAATDAMNADATNEVELLCRVAAARFDGGETDRQAIDDSTFPSIARDAELVLSLYSENGETIYTNRPYLSDTLTAAEREASGGGSAYVFTRFNEAARGDWIYAATALPDGAFLCVSQPRTRWFDVLSARMGVNVAMTLLAVCAVLALLMYLNARDQRFFASILRVMEDFSEGRFDSRIAGGQGDTIEEAARFNETIGRLNDRVFRQKTRNDALATIFNTVQTGILAVDGSLRILLVTPVAKQLLGITGSPEGMPIQEATKSVKIDHVLHEAMLQGNVYTNEVAARSDVGRGHRPLRLYISPMMKDGAVNGAVALVEDITELRRLEQVRTDFAANVSHELKTPLTSIKGFVETLEDGAIENPEMARKFLRIIMVEADRLTRLINDILTVSKLESGGNNPPSERVRLDEMLRNVIEMLRPQADDKGVTLNLSIGGACPLVGNPDRIEQMLINLIENAIKYNKQNGVVSVSLYRAENVCNLSVADTGIGIAEENIPRLFERFYRVDKGRSRSMGGTGLGLSIVKHIVKSLDGMIEVHSKLGEGTEFLITLPCAGGDADSPVESHFDDMPPRLPKDAD